MRLLTKNPHKKQQKTNQTKKKNQTPTTKKQPKTQNQTPQAPLLFCIFIPQLQEKRRRLSNFYSSNNKPWS